MTKNCINCKYIDIDYFNEYPCCECNNESRWEQLQNTNYQPAAEDLIISELEKIKRKLILKLGERFDFGITEALNVIDEELSELKGENK